ncbi:MAG: hypothetical protein JO342_11125 [Solirubrobacterales bacterium]|nr:hypothetical protein [Solirubrobacterales bacterium]
MELRDLLLLAELARAADHPAGLDAARAQLPGSLADEELGELAAAVRAARA